MKILLVAPFFFEPHRWMISAYKTAYALSKKHQITVLTTGKKPYEKISTNLEIYRMKDWFLPDPINYSIVPGLFKKFLFITKHTKPDIVLINKYMFYTTLVIFVAKIMRLKIPFIISTDTFPGLNWHPRSKLIDIVMKIYNFVLGIPALKLADRVILFHSGNIAIAKKLKLNYIVIPNGVDIDAIKKAKLPRDLIKTSGEIWIGYVGRLESVKGWDLLAQTALQIVPRYRNVKFLFVGNKIGKEKEIKQYAHPQIKFLGHRNDVYSIMKKLDIFVLPSYSEGLPNALMEAMACGCACIASNVGGVKDLIQHKKNGLFLQPNDPNDLPKKIKYLLNNENARKQFQSVSHKIIYHKFSWTKINYQLDKLLFNITK
ncbi:hypothetical protein COY43_00860 [Candidatus Berkelbacteria bacterium CG_4_10_14_0_8_um_filter_35_9_33_8]|nr:MAG: hypothetical protein COY43_00860 [Candidatus Berkelbacteria bacterium CG_4_10_14_0_8_um_filter_35_9_33_8]